jgi:hypothetical protein
MLQSKSEVCRRQQLISSNDYFVSVRRQTVEYRLIAMCSYMVIILTTNIKNSSTAGLTTMF